MNNEYKFIVTRCNDIYGLDYVSFYEDYSSAFEEMMELFEEDFPDKNDFDENEGECAGEDFIKVYEPHTMEWTFYRVGQIDIKHENLF